MIGQWQSGRRGCDWLPYLKEMRTAEEGGRGRERERRRRRREKENEGVSYFSMDKPWSEEQDLVGPF